MSNNILLQSPVVLLGLGPVAEQRLAEDGIRTLVEFACRSPSRIARLLLTPSKRSVEKWQAAARLLLVEHANPHVAAALVEAGVATWSELGDAALKRIAKALHGGEKGPGHELSLYDIAAMQQDAMKLASTGVLHGIVRDQVSGDAITGARVKAGRREDETDEHGVFHLTRVPAGQVRLSVTHGGHHPMSISRKVEPGQFSRGVMLWLGRARVAAKPLRMFREADGAWLGIGAGLRFRTEASSLAALPEHTYLRVWGTMVSGAVRLLRLDRSRRGNEITGMIVDIAREMLPNGAKKGEILEWASGALLRTELSPRDLLAPQLRRLIGESGAVVVRRVVRGAERNRGARHV